MFLEVLTSCLVNAGRIGPPRNSWFLEIVRDSPVRSCLCMTSRPRAHTLTSPLWALTFRNNTPLILQARGTPYTLAIAQTKSFITETLFKLASAKPSLSAHPFSSPGTTVITGDLFYFMCMTIVTQS